VTHLNWSIECYLGDKCKHFWRRENLRLYLIDLNNGRNRARSLDSSGSSGGIVTKLRDGRSGVHIPIGVRYFSLLEKVQTDFGAHRTSYSVPVFFLGGKSGWRVNFFNRVTSLLC